MHLHRFLFPPHGIAELPPYTPRAPQTQPQCLGHPLTFTYPNEKRTADDQHLLLSVHISETSQSDSSLIESSQKQAYHCYPTQYRSLAGALLLNLLQKTPIRRYVTLQLFQTQLFTLICSSGLWLSLSDADEIDSFFHDSEHNSQHKQVTDHQRETLSLMSSFSDLSFCRELKVLSAEKGLSVTREDFHSDFIQQFSRYSVLSVPLVRYVIVLEQLLILFETAERSLGDVNHLLSYFFSSILIQCQASQKMLCVAVLHALRIFLRDENQRRSFLTSNVNGCIYTICTFAHSEEAQFQRIGVETLNIFFLGGDGIQDPDENGAGWILNIIKVDNSLIQHALLLGLINLAKIRPPDKFYLLWSDIFKTLITKEQIEKYTDADRSLVSSLVTLFARSAQTFEVVHNQLNSIISLLSVANRDLQNSVLDILISIARRGESERLSLMNLRAPEWVSAGLRSEPEELVFSSLQFYITYLSSIYSHSTVQAQARNTPYVKWNGVKFSRHCDQIAAQLYCYSFYEFVSLLQPHRSRRIVALSAACLSCFAELGYGASDLLSIQSTSEYIRSGDTYPYIRILLSVFYCDGNPTLSKNESEEFLNKTKLSAISLVSRTISLYSRIDARIAGVVTTIALEQTNILPLPLKFVSLIQIERGANLCNILDMIGRLCRTQNRFRHLCHEGGLLDTLVKIVSRPLDFVQDMKDIHLSIHSPIASSHLTGPPSSNTVVHRIKGDDYASPTSTVSYFAVPSMTWNDAPNSTFNDLFGMKADLERQEFHDPLDSPTIENEDLVDDALLFNHQALDQLGTSMMQTQILQGELDSVPRFLTDSLPTSQWILKSALNTIYCILDRTTLPYLTKNTQTEPIGTTLSRNSPWLLDCLLLNRYSIVQRTARKLLFSVISLSSIQPDPYHIIIPPSTRRMIPLPPPPLIDDGRKGLAIFHFPPTASPRFLPTLPLDRSPATLHSATKFLSVCLREHLDTLTSLASYWESLGSNPQTQLIPSAREHMNSLVDRDRCLRELLEEYLQQSTLITRDDIAYSVLKTENLIQYCCQLFMHPLSSNHLRSALVYLLAIVTDRFEALRTRILTDTLEMIGKVCNVTQLSEAGSPSHQGAFLPCTSTAALYKLYYQLVRTDDSVATPSMYEAAIQRLEKSTQSGATSSFNNFITLKSALVDTYPVQGKVGLNTLLPVFRISVLCQIIALNFSAGMGPFIRSDCSYFDIAYHSRSDQQALMMKYMGGKGFAQTLARPPPRYVYDAISFLLALHIMHNFSKRVKDDPVLSTMPFFRTWTPDPNLLKADSIPCEHPNPIDPELIKHLPSYSPHQLYPVAYSTNSLSADSMKQLSKLEYDQYLQRRSNNYRLFMNCLDKWLVKARQMKQTGNSDILIWNILYRFAFDCQTCETLRGLMDIAQPPPDLGEMINSSKCRDGVELICTIMSTAGAPLEVLIMASTLLAIVAEGKGETQLTQTSPTDSTYTTRTEILRKKVETYSIVKIINLLSSPIPELRLNASRILLALTDHKLGLMAIDDPKAVTTLVSVLDDEPGEILENLIWTIANATQSSNSMRTLFADHHVVSQLIKILKQQVSSSTDHDAITLISPIVCCISNLVEQNSENSREFFKADGIEFFLSLLTTIKSMEETVSFCLISTLVNVSQRLLEANWELGQFDMTNPQVEPTLQQMILSVFVVIQQSDHSHQCETDCVMRSSSFLRLKTHFDTIAVPNHLSLIWDYAKKFPKPPTCVIQTQRTRDSSDIVDEEETNVTEPIIHGEDENEIQKQGLFRPLVGRTRSLDSSYSVRTALLDIIEEFCFHQKFSIVLSDSLKPMSIPTPLASRAFAQEDQANIRSAEFESPFD
ncbi:hypothetical protein BLNAU_7295 [Blattamonas nauphoetae]|uniref:Uncharacterized protein n=1 Tax=Blattamonas nauphoetae TaxID=2049346 RepID=A0ABQ9Y1N2_9EUKA|nr:hypothetical protein BLNAU_7295 [Blattamonas nauphoetae]